MRTAPSGVVAGVSLAIPHQFLVWHGGVPYLVSYQPSEAGKALVRFSLADPDYHAAWMGGEETVDMERAINCGGYLHLVKWAEAVVAIECDYAEAEDAYQRQQIKGPAHAAA